MKAITMQNELYLALLEAKKGDVSTRIIAFEELLKQLTTIKPL